MPQLKRFDYEGEFEQEKMSFTKNQKLAIGIVSGILLALISFLVGRHSVETPERVSTNELYYRKLIQISNENDAHEFVIKNVDSSRIRDHLKYFTSFPHMAGTPGGLETTDYVFDTWSTKQKMDSVQKVEYEVLLDFPNENKPNTIQISLGSNVTKMFDLNEEIYDHDLNYTKIAKPFLAYAANGSVTSDELYFANYCREKDFALLVKNGFNLTNKLVICKYGNGFRGNKIEFAQMFNASGVLLYDDPKRSASLTAQDFIYPKGEFLPPTGTQRGTIKVRKGDPSTPNYPANEFAYRKTDEAKRLLPKIPAQVIGYQTAKELFDLIEITHSNITVPSDWKGELNTTYSFGGKLINNQSITLNVNNERKLEKIYNVIGMLRGEVEPDRYIIIGNHRDAWNFGALDPNSGTSVLLEVSRVLGELKNTTDWRPRRSILFVSWDAEEYGIIGSVEWVEEFQKKLSANAVAYVNMDTVLKGNYSLRALASPLVYDLIYNVTKSIQMNSAETVFDRWLKNDPDPNSEKALPLISPHIGASSDYMGFSQKIGIPCIEQTFIRNKNNTLFKDIEIGTYPTYHSSYETFHLVSEIMDPTFNTLRLIANVVSEFGRRLSDSFILPFNCNAYANQLVNELKTFRDKYQKDIEDLDLDSDLEKLGRVIDTLIKTSQQFHIELNQLDKTKYDLVRMYNERLRNFEKAFLDPLVGLKRDGFQHMVFSPSVYNSYGGNSFTSIADAIFRYKTNKIEANKSSLLDEIREIIAIVAHSINSASSILKDPLDFTRV